MTRVEGVEKLSEIWFVRGWVCESMSLATLSGSRALLGKTHAKTATITLNSFLLISFAGLVEVVC